MTLVFSKHRRELSVGAVYLAMLLALAIVHRAYFQEQFREDWLKSLPLLIMGIGMTFVILAKQIDISIGSQFSVCGVLAALAAKQGLPMPGVALVAVLAGGLMGSLNGLLVGLLELPSIVVTLAMMVLLREGLRWIRQGAAVNGLPARFEWFGFSQTSGIGILFGIAMAVLILFSWASRNLAAARWVYAMGSDYDAARLAGLGPRRVTLFVFILMGALSGLAALMIAVQSTSADVNAGAGRELTVIAAVVVGGTAISGGRGTLLGTFLGTALLATITSALVFLHVKPQWDQAVQGIIILAAVSSDALAKRRGEPVTSTNQTGVLQQMILAQLLVIEIVLFSVIGTNFFSADNFLQIVRVSTELGLISMAMTAVIVTGGIDLSVGSMLGLSAVIFGKLWRDYQFSWPFAAGITLMLGTAGGVLNDAFITRLKIHPLIVTLATFALYRGIAEGMTGGVDNFTHFPRSFLQIGQGHLGVVPAQAPVLVLVAILFYVLLQRSTIGRAWSVIGFSPQGARYAGIPVGRRIATTYILSGAMASLAGLIYAARVGQAKADAGSGYELEAITAVVLGGTSIFGGSGTIVGTLLGLCCIEVLRNGLQMSDLKPELAGIFTSILLLGATGLDHHLRRVRRADVRDESPLNETKLNEEPIMRNSQLAVLCAFIVLAALVVVGGNYVLLRPIKPHTVTIGMMPKSVGNPYFIACQKGATEAAGELGVKLLWNGPTDSDPGRQNEIVENWINRKVDVIAVSADNAAGISTALREARSKGIKVITWDADAEHDARDFTVVQATPQGIGTALMDNAARVMGGRGKFAIITASLTASNQNEWMKWIEKRRVEQYPGIQQTVVLPCDDNQPKATDAAKQIMNSDPEVKLILAISSAAVPGAGEAVQQSGRTDVHVVGLGLPNDNKPFVKAGITPAVILWNTMDLGYLTICAAQAIAEGSLKTGVTSLDAGRLGQIKIDRDNVMLGVPFVFTKENIDKFDF